MPAPGIAALRVQRGHRRQGEVLHLDVGDLVPAQRHRDPRIGRRPDRVGGRHRPVLGVLVVVEEHAVALLLPPLAGRDRGARRSTSRASASAARRTSRNVQRGSMRTLMWMPREPEVFGQPTSPTSSSASLTTSATSRTCVQGTPGTGSRSTRSSSGWSRSSARTGCGLRSMQPRLTTQARPAASSRTISSAVRPDGKVSSTVWIQSGRLSGRALLEEGLLRRRRRRSA